MKPARHSQITHALLALMFTSTSLYAAPLGDPSAPAIESSSELVQLRCRPNQSPEACAAGGGGGSNSRAASFSRRSRANSSNCRARAARPSPSSPPSSSNCRARGVRPSPSSPPNSCSCRARAVRPSPSSPPNSSNCRDPRRQAQPEQPAEQQQLPRPRRQAQPQQPAEQQQLPRPRRQAQPEQPAEQQQLPRPRRQAQPEQPAEQQQLPRPRRQAQPEQPAEQQQLPRPRRQAQPEQPAEQQQLPRPRRQAQPEQPAEQQLPRPRRQAQPGQQPADTPVLRPGRNAGQQPQPDGGQQQAQPKPVPNQPQEARPVPRNDLAAQERVRRVKPAPVNREEGRRIQGEPRWAMRERDNRPRGAEVVRELGGRLIFQVGTQVLVESNERPRIRHNSTDYYSEELPGGRIRETVIRADGTRVVTIYNRYGDIVRRSRIMSDDREYVLVYVDDEDYASLEDWRDPGLDLPPLVLDIPREEYILDAEYVDNDEDYYAFLEQPPVEDVERLYSIDEVKRSARVRQKTRRVDLDTITFEFGSAAVPESEISRLEGVANAMLRLLEKNPAETFLIEGHTDAVGSDYANLALSDQRAEAVANALTAVFEIPPENLTTQGYGEEFLKVQADGPERENRRVAIRRITPLVAPVASAN